MKYFIIKLFVLFLVQLFSLTLFAQPSDFLRYETNKYNSNALNDSVKINASIYNSNSSVNPYLVGAIVGGSTIVLTSIPFLVADVNYFMPWIGAPLIAGGVAFLFGWTIASLNQSSKADGNFGSMRLFNQFGVLTSFSTQIGTWEVNADVAVSFTYRILNYRFYIPSKFSLLYGVGKRTYYTKKYYGFEGPEHKIGIEAIFVDYSKVFSFLYGLEGGVQYFNGNYSFYNTNTYQEEIAVKKMRSSYFTLIGGINVNYSGWLSWEFTYKYAFYNVGDKIVTEGNDLLMKRHFIATTVAIYF